MCCTNCEVGWSADKKFCGHCGRPTQSADSTDFMTKCEKLADLFINYEDDERFADLFEYHTLGLPLAYLVANLMVEVDEDGEAAKFIKETWEAFLLSVGETYDSGYGSYDSVAQLIGDE